MSAPLNLPWVSALGLSLVHFLWRGCLVWAAAALLLRLARHSGPRARYAIALTGLLACGLMPALDFAGRLDGEKAEAVEIVLPRATSPNGVLQPASGVPTKAFESRIQPYLSWIVLVWSFGALLLAFRTCSGLVWVHRIRQRDLDETPAIWQTRLAQLGERLNLRRLPELKVSRLVDSPMVIGWWRPVVLLPAAAISGIDPLLLEALLAHELAHIKRLDYLVNLLQHALEMLLFYHPAIWWLSRQVRMERELICDELAAGILGEPRRLALALKELDHFQLTTHQLAQAAHGGNLMKRIRNLIQPDLRPFSFRSWFALGTGALLILAGGILAARQQSSGEKSHPVSAKNSGSIENANGTAEKLEAKLNGLDKKMAAFDRQMGAHDDFMNGLERRMAGLDHSESVFGGRSRVKLDKDRFSIKENGVTYVIQDPAFVSRAKAIYQPVKDLEDKMGRLGGEMGGLGGKMGNLGGQMGALGGELGAIGGKIGDVASKIAAIQVKLAHKSQNPEDRQRLENQMKDLEAQMEGLEQEMENKETAQKASMKDLESNMKTHEQAMEVLEKQMDALGKQLDKAHAKTETAIQALIQEAKAAGKVARVQRY